MEFPNSSGPPVSVHTQPGLRSWSGLPQLSPSGRQRWWAHLSPRGQSLVGEELGFPSRGWKGQGETSRGWALAPRTGIRSRGLRTVKGTQKAAQVVQPCGRQPCPGCTTQRQVSAGVCCSSQWQRMGNSTESPHSKFNSDATKLGLKDEKGFLTTCSPHDSKTNKHLENI